MKMRPGPSPTVSHSHQAGQEQQRPCQGLALCRCLAEPRLAFWSPVLRSNSKTVSQNMGCPSSFDTIDHGIRQAALQKRLQPSPGIDCAGPWVLVASAHRIQLRRAPHRLRRELEKDSLPGHADACTGHSSGRRVRRVPDDCRVQECVLLPRQESDRRGESWKGGER